jgi:2-keto-4-pentenoate hydratase/2-oxohepta-3-ene-1,7-dioic acid hydratase in catechol pathway
MKLLRFELDGEISMGELQGNVIFPLAGDLMHLTRRAMPGSSATVPLAQVRLLSPTQPSKVVAVGPNYHAHLKGGPAPARPYYWIKPSTAANHPDAPIHRPDADVPMNHESELGIVIGRTARAVDSTQALEYVLGYTCINDVSLGLMSDLPKYRASLELVDGKIWDGFAPMGPVIETQLDTADLRVRCRVNGATRQDHRTSDMIWNPRKLVSMISHVVTLLPGDVIATGSPPGVGPLSIGDVVEVDVEGIGILRNTVVAAST